MSVVRTWIVNLGWDMPLTVSFGIGGKNGSRRNRQNRQNGNRQTHPVPKYKPPLLKPTLTITRLALARHWRFAGHLGNTLLSLKRVGTANGVGRRRRESYRGTYILLATILVLGSAAFEIGKVTSG